MWGMWKVIFLQNRAFWWLDLATRMSCKFEPRDNCQARLYFLSCSAPAVVTLQLPACFTRVTLWWLASHDSVSRFLLNAHILSFFTLSHTQPLHYSHLNTKFLHAELQVNLAQNKANTWLIKFNFTISPFGYSVAKHPKTDSRLKRELGTMAKLTHT